MNEDDIAVAVVEWAREQLPELNEGRSWLTAHKTKLPDVVADVAEKAIVLRDERFPRLDIEQAALRVFEVEMSFMVDKQTGDTADREETMQLRDFGARLEASLASDGTLGDRVFAASPVGATFSYRLPFVQYEDGTRGRQMALSFPIAEPVQPEDF